jgi:hypothetical protein
LLALQDFITEFPASKAKSARVVEELGVYQWLSVINIALIWFDFDE